MGGRIAVVGGGVTGLATCYFLEKLGEREITLFEAGSFGGKLQTSREGDFLVEHGPDSIFLKYPETLPVLEELGFGGEILEPRTRRFSIYVDGQLWPISPGLTRLGALDPVAVRSASFLSLEAQEVALREESVSVGEGEDESVGGFFARRFGCEYAEKVLVPLFAGTHGGDAELLSMRAFYPALQTREKRYGSLRAAALAGAGSSPARFVSLQNGLCSLPERLQSALRWTVRRDGAGRVDASNGSVQINDAAFDSVALAIPAQEAGRLIPSMSGLFARIKSVSSSIVTLGYESAGDRLEGSGFLVGGSETSPLLGPIGGATFSSSKWAGRAPERMGLVRVFFRGESSSVDEAVAAMDELLGLGRAPLLARMDNWKQGLPQYRMGHLELVERIRLELLQMGSVFALGQFFGGAGIADCLRQARETAETISHGGSE